MKKYSDAAVADADPDFIWNILKCRGLCKLSIIVIGITEIAVGLYGILLALNVIASFSKIAKDMTPYRAEQFSGAVPLSIVTMLLAFFVLCLGISLIKKNPLSRLMHVILSPLIAIFIVNTLWVFVIRLISFLNVTSLLKTSELLIGAILIMAITIGYIYYFTRPGIKNMFRRANSRRILHN